jgi:hypothetical protein
MRAATLLIGWLVTAMGAATVVRDLDGHVRRPFAPNGHGSVLVFLTTDCPIANAYAPEIQDVCRTAAPKGIECLLVYEDPGMTPSAARAHLAAYRYSGIPAAIDADGTIAQAAAATVTPEAVLIDATGTSRYRGRIDNLYVGLGRRRQAATIHDLRDAIAAVLMGRAIARPRTEAFGCSIMPPRRPSKETR